MGGGYHVFHIDAVSIIADLFLIRKLPKARMLSTDTTLEIRKCLIDMGERTSLDVLEHLEKIHRVFDNRCAVTRR